MPFANLGIILAASKRKPSILTTLQDNSYPTLEKITRGIVVLKNISPKV